MSREEIVGALKTLQDCCKHIDVVKIAHYAMNLRGVE